MTRLTLSVATMMMLACTTRESAQTDSAIAGGDSGAGDTAPASAPVLDSTSAAASGDSVARSPAPTPRRPTQPPPPDTATKRKSITDQPVKSDPEPPTTPPAVRPS